VTLVHQIQATHEANHTGALLLFDISGFFDHINPDCTTQLFRNKGFPPEVCAWVASFLTTRTATLRGGDYVSKQFKIDKGTPQGSPLSPILSAIYTSRLLDLANRWRHKDLSLYVDDGAIYAVSVTSSSTTRATLVGYKEVIVWLAWNSLQVNPEKTELMMFTCSGRASKHTRLINTAIKVPDYDTGKITMTITTRKPLRFLGIFIDRKLTWQHHVTTMACCA
jgi:hypothetical protein